MLHFPNQIVGFTLYLQVLFILNDWLMNWRNHLETVGQMKKRGRTDPSRSLLTDTWSLQGRDQCSRWAWGCRAGSPGCPRGRWTPSRWPAPCVSSPRGRSRTGTRRGRSGRRSALGGDVIKRVIHIINRIVRVVPGDLLIHTQGLKQEVSFIKCLITSSFLSSVKKGWSSAFCQVSLLSQVQAI